MQPSEDEGAFLITFLCEIEFFGKSSLSDAYVALKLTEFVSELMSTSFKCSTCSSTRSN